MEEHENVDPLGSMDDQVVADVTDDIMPKIYRATRVRIFKR